MDYCCEGMWKQFEIEPDDERLIFYQEEHQEYGLIDRKDPRAYTPIAFCPWCGKDILSVRFKTLERKSRNATADSENEKDA
jgi:hypothetical protein